jgi:hopanoid biosynthesis associated radical SAM protein HpnJ
MRTLLLNPPSFHKFDGGASSRWPATREIESYWYPVWLCYPAGMIPDSKVVDAPPHGVSIAEVVALAADYELLVLFTSTPGLAVDLRMAGQMKDLNPRLKIAFVGPPATVEPEKILGAGQAVDFVVRREFDHQIADFARGKPLAELPGVSFRQNGGFVHHRDAAFIDNLDALPWVTPIYRRDLDITRYNVPFLLHPFIAFYTSRGCPAVCTYCLWPQTHSGHRWRLRSADDVAAEVRYAREAFPGLQEIFFDDDTFNYQKARTLELCRALKPLNFTWSCTSRVTTDYETLKAMKEAGCRLLIVGYESGDPQILKNIKKGATVDMAERFTRDCRRLGLQVHADYIVGLPGETPESLRRTIEFAKRLDCTTIQVSIAHPYPGTEFHDYAVRNGLLSREAMTDEGGHQLPTVVYPGLGRAELLDWVERFYGEYYFRPRVIWRIARRALWDGAERRRLMKEAREYLRLRAQRKRFVRSHKQATPAQ